MKYPPELIWIFFGKFEKLVKKGSQEATYILQPCLYHHVTLSDDDLKPLIVSLSFKNVASSEICCTPTERVRFMRLSGNLKFEKLSCIYDISQHKLLRPLGFQVQINVHIKMWCPRTARLSFVWIPSHILNMKSDKVISLISRIKFSRLIICVNWCMTRSINN